MLSLNPIALIKDPFNKASSIVGSIILAFLFFTTLIGMIDNKVLLSFEDSPGAQNSKDTGTISK